MTKKYTDKIVPVGTGAIYTLQPYSYTAFIAVVYDNKLPEDIFINVLNRSIRWDTSHANSSRHCTEELIKCMKEDADNN